MILFITELECHPKERILLLFRAFSFWNSPKRMHPKNASSRTRWFPFQMKWIMIEHWFWIFLTISFKFYCPIICYKPVKQIKQNDDQNTCPNIVFEFYKAVVIPRLFGATRELWNE